MTADSYTQLIKVDTALYFSKRAYDLANSIFGSQSEISFSVWASPDTISTTGRVFSECKSSGATRAWLTISSNKWQFNVGDTGGTKTVATTTSAVIGQYDHIVGVYSVAAGTMKIYLNGTEEGSTAVTLSVDTSTKPTVGFTVGAWHYLAWVRMCSSW